MCVCVCVQFGKISDKNNATKYLIPLKPTVCSKLVTKKEYEYLKERSRVITKEEKETAIEMVEKEKERLTKESIKRKEAIRKMDTKKRREKNSRTRKIEEEARKKMVHILERAHNMRLEQEEEIQKCNRFILATKCQAIRDAQVIVNSIMSFRYDKVFLIFTLRTFTGILCN